MTPIQRVTNNLNLIIMPTEGCNFRCTYCYEDFSIGKMKRPTIEGIKNLIRRRVENYGLERLELSWFGGEPLLAQDVIWEIAEFAHKMHADGLIANFSGSLTTNAAFLAPDVLARLCSLKQRTFQISLDGYGAGHDATRRHFTGKGTFEGIWQNLKAAHAGGSDFEILLRLHLTKSNLSSMGSLIKCISEELGGDRRFAVLFKLVENYGGENGAEIDALDPHMAAPSVRLFGEALAAAGIPFVDGTSAEFESMTGIAIDGGSSAGVQSSEGCGYVCYAAKPWSFVVRANGRLSKCTVDLKDDKNLVGSIEASGRLRIDDDKMAYWMRGYRGADSAALGCPAHAH